MIVIGQEAASQEVAPGMTRKILATSPKLMVCEVALSQGTVVPDHRHPHEQSTYVISGRIRAVMGGREMEMGAGDSYLAAGEVGHSVVALEDCLLLDIFTPQRDDFL